MEMQEGCDLVTMKEILLLFQLEYCLSFELIQGQTQHEVLQTAG